jgi:hypothetical protein
VTNFNKRDVIDFEAVLWKFPVESMTELQAIPADHAYFDASMQVALDAMAAERAEAEARFADAVVSRLANYQRKYGPTPPGMLSVAEVASRLGINKPDVVLGFIKAGELVAVNVSKGTKRALWRVKVQDLDAFIARRTSVQPTLPARRRRKNLDGPTITNYFRED